MVWFLLLYETNSLLGAFVILFNILISHTITAAFSPQFHGGVPIITRPL